MSIETDLYAVLSGVNPSVYPTRAPNDPPMPFITWQQIGGEMIRPLANELASKRNAVFQINVWSKTALEAKSIIQQISQALVTSNRFIARPQSEFLDRTEEDLDWFGAQQDFSIWGDR